MKKLLLVVLLFSTAVLFAQNPGSVTIKNETGYQIDYIYFSPSSFDDWGDDFLGEEGLNDGDEIDIVLDREIDDDQFIYDIQAVDEDNDYYTIYEIDISENPDVNITMDAYDGGEYDDYEDYDYSGYEDGYNDGYYSEGYKQGYVEAFRDAYIEGFRAAQDVDLPSTFDSENPSAGGWR